MLATEEAVVGRAVRGDDGTLAGVAEMLREAGDGRPASAELQRALHEAPISRREADTTGRCSCWGRRGSVVADVA